MVTTDVGGNREVVCRNELGIVVPYGDAASLESALASALKQRWDKATILSYASENSWDSRVVVLKNAFEELVADEK